jgi:hypothetical protein
MQKCSIQFVAIDPEGAACLGCTGAQESPLIKNYHKTKTKRS